MKRERRVQHSRCLSLTPRFSEVGPARKKPSTVSTVYLSSAALCMGQKSARIGILASLSCSPFFPHQASPPSLSILPSPIPLHGPESRQQLILEKVRDN